MMNIWNYWFPGVLKSLWANICFWNSARRPLGALYYLPLYHFFSLNPQPYRIVQITILAASIPMIYYLAWLLAGSRSATFLAVLALCYHAQLATLVFVGSFIYDVLCGFFYFAALTYYVHIRKKGLQLRPMQLLAFLALYVCALNAKEMAVTLPLIVLVYELLKYYDGSERQKLLQWIWHNAMPALLAGLFTAIYCYNKTRGPEFAGVETYTPHYSWDRFTSSNAHFVSELFYHSVPIKGGMVLVIWVLVFAYAFLRRDHMLKLMAFWVVIVPLPLAFIPLRGGGCLYLLLFGWAMIFGKLVTDLIGLLAKSSALLDQGVGAGATTGAILGGTATNRVRGAAIGAILGVAACKMSPRQLQVFATVAVASVLAIFTHWENQRFGYIRGLLMSEEKICHVIQALRSLDLHPASGSKIFVKEKHLFVNEWNVAFLAALVWNDHSLRIYPEGIFQLDEQRMAEMSYVISLNETQAELIRVPNSNSP